MAEGSYCRCCGSASRQLAEGGFCRACCGVPLGERLIVEGLRRLRLELRDVKAGADVSAAATEAAAAAVVAALDGVARVLAQTLAKCTEQALAQVAVNTEARGYTPGDEG